MKGEQNHNDKLSRRSFIAYYRNVLLEKQDITKSKLFSSIYANLNKDFRLKSV